MMQCTEILEICTKYGLECDMSLLANPENPAYNYVVYQIELRRPGLFGTNGSAYLWKLDNTMRGSVGKWYLNAYRVADGTVEIAEDFDNRVAPHHIGDTDPEWLETRLAELMQNIETFSQQINAEKILAAREQLAHATELIKNES